MRACVCTCMHVCVCACVCPSGHGRWGPGQQAGRHPPPPPGVPGTAGPFSGRSLNSRPELRLQSASFHQLDPEPRQVPGKFPASSRGSRDGADANCPMQIIWALCKPLLQEELPRCGPAPTRPCLTLTPAGFSLLTIQAASAHGPASPGSQHPRADSAGPRRPPPRAVTCSYALGLCGSVRPPTVTGQPGLPPKLRPSSPGLLQCDLLWEKGLCRCN